MNTTTKQRIQAAALIAASALTSLAAGVTALADDTEILGGQTLNYAQPNILFVIDTSGSMDSQLLVDDSFDPTITYSGPYTDTTRLYWGIVDRNGVFDFPDEAYQDLGLYVNVNTDGTGFVCDAATFELSNAAGAGGFFIDFFAQFDPNPGVESWDVLNGLDADPDLSGVDRFTECLSDNGLHGALTGAAEMYPLEGTPPAGGVPYTGDPDDPNVIDWTDARGRYVIFSNNFVNWVVSSLGSSNPVVDTRLGVVQERANNLLNQLTIDNPNLQESYNVGLMRFSTNGNGGMVVKELSDVRTNAAELRAAFDSLTSSNSTPLAESLYEAFLYYSGGAPEFGDESTPTTSVAASQSGGNYISPIAASCQKNYVVFLTDGLPTSDEDADMQIGALTGTCAGNCLDELAQYMDQTDLNATLEGTQSVQTFTIGFFTDSDLLRQAATGLIRFDADGNELDPPQPGFFLADDVSGLQRAFDSIIHSITTDVDIFTSPAVSVNSLNRLTNRDVLYFTMFNPAPMGEEHWDGNLKAYFVGRPAGTEGADITILDANRNAATEENGVFKPNAQSIWSQNPDGGVVTAGGMASLLSDQRVVVSNIVGGSLLGDANRVVDSNDDITAADLGIEGDFSDATELEARRQLLLEFGRGINPDGTVRKIIGDPLHSQPLVITYDNEDSEDLLLVFTTNDGYFHAIDPTPTEGSMSDLEDFAFIPRELLPNLDTIERNEPSLPNSAAKLYGLDGPITSLISGGDGDSVVESTERLFIYFGMRRGGESYYALDFGVGGRMPPRLAWKISRGDADFEKLAQTWSAATPVKVKVGGTATDVLIFGGGYDEDQDTSNATNIGDGNAIYIVNAETGSLIWSASNSGADLNLEAMTYSIPSDINVIDTDQDGLADRLYVGDMGAQVWRFDIDNFAAGTGLTVTGAVFADLGGEGTANERRFFNESSVARIFVDDENFLVIGIGSGYRAHPLDTVIDDKFYLLKDYNVFTPQVDSDGVPTYAAPVTEADLFAAGEGDVISTTANGGWILDLAASGEKNLSQALIVDNNVFFTTYLPSAATATSCQPTAAVGGGRLYAVSILAGLPALFDDGIMPTSFIELDRTGIPPSPTLVFTEPPCTEDCGPDGPDPLPPPPPPDNPCIGAASEVTMLVATETIDPEICTAPVRTYWYESDIDADDN